MTRAPEGFREAGGAVVLYADNYINEVEGEKLEALCETFLKKGATRIVIDFSSTDIINSIGISILIGILEKVRGRNGTLLFSGLKQVNRDIFALVGLTEHIRIFDTEEDAVSSGRPGGAHA